MVYYTIERSDLEYLLREASKAGANGELVTGVVQVANSYNDETGYVLILEKMNK